MESIKSKDDFTLSPLSPDVNAGGKYGQSNGPFSLCTSGGPGWQICRSPGSTLRVAAGSWEEPRTGTAVCKNSKGSHVTMTNQRRQVGGRDGKVAVLPPSSLSSALTPCHLA